MQKETFEEATFQSPLKVASFCLLAGMLVYPFSIAGSNFFFGIALLTTIFKSDIIVHGLKVCWNDYRPITIGITLFITLTFAGSFWSYDMGTTTHKIGKQLNWFIIPAIVGILYYAPDLRKKIFIALSTGMFLHLIVCTLQYVGIFNIDSFSNSVLGSNKEDATGFVGHLSFGFMYGIWAGALIIASQHMTRTWRHISYASALYAVVTIFLAQGQSGYLITITLIILIIWKVLFPEQLKLKLLILATFLILATLFISLHEPSQKKITTTWSGVVSFLDGDWSQADERIKIWATSYELWKTSPWFGIGTGDYKQDAIKLLQNEEFRHLRSQTQYAASHNEFLFELTRWGPLGLLAVLYLCWSWLRIGWQKDWKHDTMNAFLCTSSALAIIISGLTEVSLNGQMETVFAMLMLAFSMTSKSAYEQR